MGYTKQHFELIASIISGARSCTCEEDFDSLASVTASKLTGTNPNFNHSRFMDATQLRED